MQQQLGVIQQTLQSVDSTASDSLTTGAFMRAESGSLGISVGDDALNKEIANRSTLPFRLQLSIITVNALPSAAGATAKPAWRGHHAPAHVVSEPGRADADERRRFDVTQEAVGVDIHVVAFHIVHDY